MFIGVDTAFKDVLSNNGRTASCTPLLRSFTVGFDRHYRTLQSHNVTIVTLAVWLNTFGKDFRWQPHGAQITNMFLVESPTVPRE